MAFVIKPVRLHYVKIFTRSAESKTENFRHDPTKGTLKIHFFVQIKGHNALK